MLFRATDIEVTLTGDVGVFHAVKGVSLKLDGGDILDITGPSGAGKSTLLHALGLQVVSPQGAMFLNDVAHLSFTAQQWRRHVALVQQKPVLVAGSIEENLYLPWSLKLYTNEQRPSQEALLQALERAHLEDIALDRPIDKLSVGQQARVAFLRTLLTDPEVLLLDEVDAALDDESAEAIGEMTGTFAHKGKAVVRVRHRADDGRATRHLLMQEGRMVGKDPWLATSDDTCAKGEEGVFR